MIILVAPPPPLQMEAKPYLALFCFKMLTKEVTILDPEEPVFFV